MVILQKKDASQEQQTLYSAIIIQRLDKTDLLFEKDASQESETLYLVTFIQQKKRCVSRVGDPLLNHLYTTKKLALTTITEKERKEKMHFKSLRLFIRPSLHDKLGLTISKHKIEPLIEKEKMRLKS